MKKFGMVLLVLASMGFARQIQAIQSTPQQAQANQRPNSDVGNAPTPNDMYCSGYISSERISERLYVVAGANSPDQVRYAGGADTIFIHGQGMKQGERYQIVRHVKDPNHYELFRGQKSAIKNAGETYFELGYVKVVDVQKETGIAVPELSCADFVPGDLAIPFVEREKPVFRQVSLDPFAAPNGKTVGRILMAKDFDSFIGTKHKVYINFGTDKGLKPGDYLKATRTFSYTYHDPEAGLSLRASENEDTQVKGKKLQKDDVSGLPRRTLGDMIVLQVHQRSATAMVLTALQDIHVGDGVELMDVSNAPELAPMTPTYTNDAGTSPSDTATRTTNPVTSALPTITCTASPTSVRAGESSTINCNAASPDNRPVSITYVTNGGKLSSSKNQATLDTTGAGPGPISVRATVFDDQQLSAAAVTTVNVEAPPPPMPTAQQLTSLDFKPMSAYVDNRSKAILDDVALKLQQDPTSTAVLSGSSDEKEPPRLAMQRAENAKTYLTKSKGIDPQRIQVRAGSDPGHRVDVVTVPAGATAPTPQPK
jgi:outer membrane protein OmpA-like peptidoglycan-associated protein